MYAVSSALFAAVSSRAQLAARSASRLMRLGTARVAEFVSHSIPKAIKEKYPALAAVIMVIAPGCGQSGDAMLAMSCCVLPFSLARFLASTFSLPPA